MSRFKFRTYNPNLHLTEEIVEDYTMLDERPRKTVYIAGPMTAHRDRHYNFPVFYASQGLLEMLGYRVHNPARMDMDTGKAAFSPFEGRVVTSSEFTLADAMRRDIKIIADCDAIVLLKGWEDSTGARKELRVATEDFGLPAYELTIDANGWPVLTELLPSDIADLWVRSA